LIKDQSETEILQDVSYGRGRPFGGWTVDMI